MDRDPIIADLHCHSWYSDGTQSPQALIQEAAKRGLSAVSLTDHDAIEGLNEAQEACDRFGVTLVFGVELSCNMQGCEVHCLAYGFDPHDEDVILWLKNVQQRRLERLEAMLRILGSFGFPTKSVREVVEASGVMGTVSRLHLAEAMVVWGWVENRREAFQRFLNICLDRVGVASLPSLEETIPVFTQAGGTMVLAHPHINNRRLSLTALMRSGLNGVELYCPGMRSSPRRRYLRFAQRHQWIITGGSDCHGGRSPHRHLGQTGLTRSQWESVAAVIARQ